MEPLRPAAVVHMHMTGSFPTPEAVASPAAVRRLQRDYQKLLEEPLPGIHALPTDANILEWHYVIEGSPDTAYYGGYYHGKIVFQPEFPWKPPAICMCTPNGRFRTNMRLCLSISDYHPETWNPGWTVSSILVGLHSFMNEETYAAGVQNETAEQRRRYADDSIRYNLSNPEFTRMFPTLADLLRAAMATATATSRLKKDYQRLLKEPVPFLQAAPLQDNILEWHYIIYGAPNTPYDGGVYHGKLVFPSDFPFKPPSIYMITPSGRFQTNTRLCLSISDFHPDTWNPAWTVSTIITGLLSFMNDTAPTLGSITSTDAEKRLLAKRSKAFNLKNRIFCELFPDVVDEVKKELSQSGSEETVNPESEKQATSLEPTSGLSSLVSNLFVVAGVVVLALAVRYVIRAAQEQDPSYR